ncbi:PorP/SprF family type IX secretion system membrane protein [Allomuricauda sp. d1]|uniref:PorP/SprF family type IX secretion system membrane protein n=1 Tax=Allomuricauda sp. d1 TaxID=3136725 RepID=UPI0031D54282
MRKAFGICFCLFLLVGTQAQEVSLPEDLRQHNLTQFNASLLNPTYSYDWNRPHAASFWSRWQWQTIDGDPTTLFFSYTHKLSAASTIGGGFIQHNTGTFLNTGGLLNYTHAINFDPNIKLLLGANILGFQQELADDRFMPNPDIDLPVFSETNDFLLQFTPGARLLVNNFSVALALENAIDINLTDSDRDGLGSIFIGALSNDFPVYLSEGLGNSFVRPLLYVKTIPNADTQIGLNALFSTSKFWFQGGYNNFYGPSLGLGLTFFKHFSVGGLMEFSTGDDLDGEDSTFELLVSYHFGKAKPDQEVESGVEEEVKLADELPKVEEEQEEQDEQKRQQEAERLQRERDSINQALAEAKQRQVQDSIRRVNAQQKQQREQDSIAMTRQKEADAQREQKRLDSIAKLQQQEREAEALREQRRLDSLAQVREKEARAIIEQRRTDSIAELQQEKEQAEALQKQQRADSIAEQQRKEAEALREQQRLDSIAKLQQQEEVEVKPGEKYEEVTRNEDGLQPGFYLIANVFGTKKYFDNFMKTLQEKGLNPKSFYRKLNKYNYVYLERYDTVEEARKARDSKFNGKYPDKTWIFRVRLE